VNDSGSVLEAEKKRSLKSLTGFLIILLIYLVLAATAAFLYPKGFNPLTNTLGQLGNPTLNPSGAIFYNIGIFIVSCPIFLIAILVLSFGKEWKAKFGIKNKLMFHSVVGFMVLFALLNILTAVFPAGTNDTANSLYTLLFFISFEFFVVLSALGIRNVKDRVDWVPKLGFAVATINLGLVIISAVSGVSTVSWILAILSWSYMLAFVYQFS
jgi:hypothetical protein